MSLHGAPVPGLQESLAKNVLGTESEGWSICHRTGPIPTLSRTSFRWLELLLSGTLHINTQNTIIPGDWTDLAGEVRLEEVGPSVQGQGPYQASS